MKTFFGYNKRFIIHPDNYHVFKGFQIPWWQEALDIILKCCIKNSKFSFTTPFY